MAKIKVTRSADYRKGIGDCHDLKTAGEMVDLKPVAVETIMTMTYEIPANSKISDAEFVERLKNRTPRDWAITLEE